jgi:uncharacterized protein YndB with AHSA1/START domain
MASAQAKLEMLIRRPVAEVFTAFVRPEQITRFWLKHTTGPLFAGARVEWEFLVPAAIETVTVTAFEQARRNAFDWSDGIGVDMRFAEDAGRDTRVAITATGFDGDAAVDAVVTATEGFAIVLCDLKTLLETGRSANLVRDKAALIDAKRLR